MFNFHARYHTVIQFFSIFSLFLHTQTLAQSTLGDAGLVVIPLMVAISTIGAATGGMYAGSRVHYTTARDGNFMELFSLIQNKFQTPITALLFQVGT